ncbi:immunity protein YezG family protein [Bhargavaea beijingensis]|nr:immunity protein YezG family protein [Bhargavaea beijingensis]MCW1928973.1 antitoxin YezG family protein [Bhargavaea beijingensis]
MDQLKRGDFGKKNTQSIKNLAEWHSEGDTMDKEKEENLYTYIANTVLEMIPGKWDWIKLYAEYWDGYYKCYFYYSPAGSGEHVYSLDIPNQYEVSQETFDRLDEQLYGYIKALWNEFKNQGETAWTNLTLSLQNDGKMKIDYDYSDLSDLNPLEKRKCWESNYLLGGVTSDCRTD